MFRVWRGRRGSEGCGQFGAGARFVLVVFDVKMWGVVRRPAVDSSREVDEVVFGAAGLRFAVKGVLYRTIQNFAAC